MKVNILQNVRACRISHFTSSFCNMFTFIQQLLNAEIYLNDSTQQHTSINKCTTWMHSLHITHILLTWCLLLFLKVSVRSHQDFVHVILLPDCYDYLLMLICETLLAGHGLGSPGLSVKTIWCNKICSQQHYNIFFLILWVVSYKRTPRGEHPAPCSMLQYIQNMFKCAVKLWAHADFRLAEIC